MEEVDKHKVRLKKSLKVPEGYFADNKARVMAEVTKDESPESLKVVWGKAYIWLSAAAVIVLGLFMYFQKPTVSSDEAFTLNDLSDATIENYLVEDYTYGLAEPLIAEALVFSDYPDDIGFENTSDEEIVEFLTNSRIDEPILYPDYED